MDRLQGELQQAIDERIPIVAFKADYQFEVLFRAFAQNDITQPTWGNMLVLDPFALEGLISPGNISRNRSQLLDRYGIREASDASLAAKVDEVRSLTRTMGMSSRRIAVRALDYLVAHQRQAFHAWIGPGQFHESSQQGWPVPQIPDPPVRKRAPGPNEPSRKWTPDEEARLIDLHRQGLSYRDIELKLGRSTGGIDAKLRQLGLVSTLVPVPQEVLNMPVSGGSGS